MQPHFNSEQLAPSSHIKHGNSVPALPLTPSQANPVSKGETLRLPPTYRPVTEVDQEIEQKGFPELNLLWRAYKKDQSAIGSPSITELQTMLSKHTQPLFGHPWAVSLGVGVCASLTSVGLAHWILPVSKGTYTMIPWIAGNLFVIGLITTSAIQRYGTAPLIKTMSSAIGTMLRTGDFRGELKSSERFKSCHSRAKNLGITSVWDDGEYTCSYQIQDGEVVRYFPKSHEQLIHETVQSFLGRKDEDSRKHIPGRYSNYLKDGKKSVSRFVLEHTSELALSKAEQLSSSEGVTLLKDLLESEVVKNSEGALLLRKMIVKFETGTLDPRNVVGVQIWQRDPWRDLTHQEEFYSSASLRGIKKMGRDSKGRLGTFEYLMNPAISCLDFSLEGKRVVRARCGIALLEDKSGGKYPILFVDGVEGSNQVPDKVILRAIQEYAHSIHVKGVYINAHAHNVVPKRFIRSVKDAGYTVGAAKIEFLDTQSRQYLDAFGTPIQPFEYALPLERVGCWCIRRWRYSTTFSEKITANIKQTSLAWNDPHSSLSSL
jgi:hypothetical protein